MEDRRYPIGKFEYGQSYSFLDVRKNIEQIAKLPKLLKRLLKKAKGSDFDKKYRPGGWTARQLVHHLADSHINAYVRFKLAMTEDHPTIRPYDENKWSELNDGLDGGVKMSISLIHSLHKRMAYFLESLTESDFKRTFFHPGSNRVFTLGESVALYTWHGKHHLAHIELALEPDKNDEKSDKKNQKSKETDQHRSDFGKSEEKTLIKAVAKLAKENAKSLAAELKSTKSVGKDKLTQKLARVEKAVPVLKSNAKTESGKLTEPKKRGPKPKSDSSNVKAVVVEPKKRGPKPRLAVAKVIAAGTEPKKRGPKPKVAVAKVIAASTEPKKRGPKPKVAVAKVIAAGTEPKKRGPKPKMTEVVSIKKVNVATKAEVQVSAPVSKPKIATPKPIAKSQLTVGEPKKRGPKSKVVQDVPKEPIKLTSQEVETIVAKGSELVRPDGKPTKIVFGSSEMPKKRGPKPKV
jgi:DinB superfamily